MAWVVVSFVAATALRRRPLALTISVLVLWVLVPGVAVHHILGSASPLSGMHPAAVLALASVVIQAAGRRDGALRALRSHGDVLTAVAVVVAVAAFVSIPHAHQDGVVAVVNELAGPIALYVLVCACVGTDTRAVSSLRNTVIGLAAAESLLALAQSLAGQPLLFASDYRAQYWFTDQFDRWMGTFDHPLVLSLFLASASFLLTELRAWWATLALLVLFGIGMSTTQSRVGFAALAVACVYLLLRARLHPVARIVAVGAGLVAARLLSRAGFFTPLQDRLADDGGSAGARQAALEYFTGHWSEFLWSGHGLGASFGVASDIGLQTSFESAFLMYSIDLGVATALLYFLAMATVIYRGFAHETARGLAPAAACSAIIIHTFSGLSGTTAVAAVVWLLLGLASRSQTSRTSRRGVEGLEPAPGGALPRPTVTTHLR